VAAGRLSAVKGFDVLLDALALLRDMEITLSILGEGPQRADLESQIARLGLGDVVSLLGFKANPQLYFAQADALVLSSHYEGFPNVVLEALACGIGVIATPAIGGVSEILDGVSGAEMADSVSAPALAKAIRRWAERPFDGITASVLDRYRGSEIADQYSRLFERVCDRRAHAGQGALKP
jgi:glycosyltransferase involved in cell wall biosynthesis